MSPTGHQEYTGSERVGTQNQAALKARHSLLKIKKYISVCWKSETKTKCWKWSANGQKGTVNVSDDDLSGKLIFDL